MLVLEFSTLVLEKCPTETIELFLSGNIPADLRFEGQNKWVENVYSSTRKKLLSALDVIPAHNAEAILRRLPTDAFYEEHAILLGKMNQHQLALSIYVHKLHVPELALSYCDRVYDLGLQQPSRSYANIYLTLLQIYLNPRRLTKEIDQKLPSSTDSGRSDVDVDEISEEGGPIMLNEALDLLSQRWDKINGAQALKLLPRDTKLQNLRSFLEPLLRKSSEGRRNYSIVKSLRYSENLQVKEELYKHRQTVVKIDGESMCALCHKRIGTSVFAVYPNGKTLVHFVCFRDSQNLKTVRGSLTMKHK
ncbi:hypothetical protein HPP92_004247 [Vanilla planifolia]|uniref:Vacuolar sorting protein 39/Transforming growth factor beta receptor-associated zinc finger domain-containing protein n=1 Tax=Vanilla planifolia TaxID=51239 RepID=A0A835VK60_VANPL|nr:hypothetical protein HPP92_004247 [Vanilla planifolia]